MSQTQAVVISAPGQVGLRTVSLKAPGATDVVIETQYTSISAGTERMLLAGQMPHPMLQLPVVPGYETVGRVVQIGADVSRDWLGKMVYVGGAMCYEDVNGAWGGQSARLFADVSRVLPLDGVDPQQGVLLALAATALHGVDVLDPQKGDRVLVLGQGPVGQLAARFAKLRGVETAVSDKSASRLAKSEADTIVHVDENTQLTDEIDQPVNAIIEATGSMAALTAALPLLANGGTVLLLGYYQKLELPYMPLFLKEAKLLTAKEWQPGDLARCRAAIASGDLNVAPLLTHSFPVMDVQAAYETALNDLDCLKLVMSWNEEEMANF